MNRSSNKRGRGRKLIAVGKLSSAMEKICAEMSEKSGVEVIVLPDEPDKDVKSALRRESDAILERIDEKDYVVLFDLHGKKMTEAIRNLPDLVYVIGGSNGVDERVKARANAKISVSGLTYPHGLFRLLSLEIILNK
ncbi:MAG: 23S rRNA (pseudouridine(1915)-N(3))-methyltransferase RlmH [Bacillota bacterium]|nr:23S rRNA (pseudouridine(1915)-N(3))-methyltransferase RlmH [Bacillota bacterium]